MIENRSLLVGFDLCNDYSQISCFDKKSYEPKSIGVASANDTYAIRTVLGLKKDAITWVFDQEALRISQQGEGFLVENIIDSIIEQKDIEISGTVFNKTVLLEKFFRKSLSSLKKYYPNESIDKIMITIKQLDMNLINVIYQALETLGLSKERVFIQSHLQSYFYFALSQKKELWMNDVGLFDFDEQGFSYYQLSINRRVSPYLVGVKQMDFSKTLNYELLEEIGQNEHLAYIAGNIAKGALHKQNVSTLYMTGKGFEGQWADEVLKELCIGRRVFKGQNLYVKGATYAARELTKDTKLKDFVFLSDEMISSTISVKVYSDARMCEVVLAKAATAWYDSEQKIDVILDNETEIELIITNLIKKETFRQILDLNDLKVRPNKMTRIEIRAQFTDGHTCIITAKDKGFGEFYPTNNRVWEEVIII